jgi:hypothetical protein
VQNYKFSKRQVAVFLPWPPPPRANLGFDRKPFVNSFIIPRVEGQFVEKMLHVDEKTFSLVIAQECVRIWFMRMWFRCCSILPGLVHRKRTAEL